ncbi:MAG: DNA repair protein RecN [Clostridia bacterium]|nr:DNA repair protein RecN [Clostridia bacterium]
MISTLHIKNIGIIDDLSIDLNQGFNVLSGETGAGKTLIIDSIEIISGGRFSKDMIRKGEEYSFVELNLYMPENEIAVDGNIIVSREVHSNGRNSCKINGRLVTVAELKEFMKKIIDIHGQHDNQNLLDSSSHIELLDSFSGEELIKIREDYQIKFVNYNKIKNELKQNYGDEKEKQRKLDLLKYQLNEIDKSNLKEDEDVELEEKRKLILNSEKISENVNEAYEQLDTNTIDSINIAIRAFEKIENIDEKYSKYLNQLKNVYYDLQELSRDISNLKDDIYFDEEERNDVEQRLDLIFSLKRKYGNSIEEILNYKNELDEEIEKIENSEEYITGLKYELSRLEEQMLELAGKMHKIREKNAKILSENINKELIDLEMKNAKINVKIHWLDENNFNSNGLNNVSFLIQTNIGEEEKELVKIASGGEMSRIMLAIKTVLADVDEVPVLIFDEIDTGISGKAAKAVGEKIKQIAKTHQVLCVTHLAPIAAKGDYNYYICKNVCEGKTKTNITLLRDENDILKEIARINAGEVTSLGLEHAKELRKCG